MPAPTASSPSSTVPAMRSRTPRVNAQSRRSKYMGELPQDTPNPREPGAADGTA